MGKSSKKRSGRNRRRGRGAPSAGGGGGDVPPPSASDPASPPSDPVIRRVRHGDPRVRHAALIALSGTVYGPSLSSSSSASEGGAAGGRASDPSLLRAVSERLLDSDVPTAIAAAGCLANYAASGAGAGEVSDGGAGGEMDVAGEVTAPILLQRVTRSLSSLEEMTASHRDQIAEDAAIPKSQSNETAGNRAKTAFERSWPKTHEQWTLLSLSLLTLAGLVENFPRVLERTGTAALPGLLAVLPLAGATGGLVRAAKESAGDGGDGSIDAGPADDAASHASRALHSLLDENPRLVSSMPVSVPDAAGGNRAPSLSSASAGLGSAASDPGAGDACRLHASGALLALRRFAVLDSEASGAALSREEKRLADEIQRTTDDAVLPLVASVVSEGDGEAGRIVGRMVELSRELAGQREDEEMESRVVGEINRKKEPARSIARRQKRMKEEREAREQARQSGGMEVEEAKQPPADNTPEGERDESMVVEDEAGGTDAPADGDPRDELDAAVASWRELAGRQKLCLELIANLCSTRDEVDEGEEDDGGVMGYGDDDERMWDSDDEARLLASAGACAGGDGAQRGRTTPSEDATFASLAGRDVPGKTLGLFLRWAAFLPSLGGDVPDLVADDVAEILEVASTCMSNMTSCDLPTWTEPATGPDGGRHSSGLAMFWSGLVPVLSAGETGRGTEAARAGAASALLSMLTSREESRCLVDEKGLETILGLLDEGGGTGADGGDDVYRIRTQCSAISILGVLCSGPHPAEVDARVCRSLLARLRSASADDSSTDPAGSCAVTHEVLNVLMDVYGGDDCHDSVMAAEDVVGHFQRCLPGFRRRVRKCSGAGSAGRGEVEVWNETALNASRFIKYCKEK